LEVNDKETNIIIDMNEFLPKRIHQGGQPIGSLDKKYALPIIIRYNILNNTWDF